MRRAMESPSNANDDVEENITNKIGTRNGATKLPRLVTRNRVFSQSSNKVRVQHQYDGRIFWLMLKYDWFHLFLRCSIIQAIVTLLGVWTGMILVFAAIYKAIDDNHPERNCGLAAPSETISYHSAFAFSLETCKYTTTNTLGQRCADSIRFVLFSLSSLSPSFDCCSSFDSLLYYTHQYY
jgi:hypothetical protein